MTAEVVFVKQSINGAAGLPDRSFAFWQTAAGDLYQVGEPPVQGVAGTLTVGAGADTPTGRFFSITATVAGDVTATLADGSSYVFKVQPGNNLFPFAVKRVTASTATAIYQNLI